MHHHHLIFLLLLASPSFSQDFQERACKTSIKEVTIFLNSAQITRNGKVTVPKGKSTLVVKSLSPYLDDKSIQVKASEGFTILSVNHKFNYLDRLRRTKKTDSLTKVMKSLDLDIAVNHSRLDVLKEKQSLLNENKNLGGQNSGASLTQLKQAIEFYEKELSAIKADELKTTQEIAALNETRSRIEKEMSEVKNSDELPSGEIHIRIESEREINGNFTITYVVTNTGWYPKYDVRVKTIEQPLQLNYKAEVFQNTGVDWKNVKLRFSNGDPNQSGLAPELSTWHLNYARNTIYQKGNYSNIVRNVGNVSGRITDETGGPLPGATVVVMGSTIGTVTDLQGNYSLTLPNGSTHISVSFVGYVAQEIPINSSNLNIQLAPDVSQLSEVVVTGYDRLQGRAPGVRIRGVNSLKKKQFKNSISTTIVENQTTVEFEVEKPYSIKSNGEKLSVNLKNLEIDALYKYYAVPKLEKDAFLIAEIVDWDQYNLMEGEANLYFEDAYVGRSVLDAKALSDTLSISLGRDRNIVIARKKVDGYTKTRTIGSNAIEAIGYKIIVRNNKSQPIKLTVMDQAPVSSISDITVTPEELSDGQMNEKTGKIVWEITLEKGEQKELNMAYEVKYPKRERIYLE
ncbi:mucoidy inhibitor MuiA family protein [Fulvivirga sp. M361]|uniref:DUF4139 domain-containing protein n=1 Tax=Fulvivirga sp. M361 TaxID=2594266 RepID=UPI00117AAE67|nr:DUF4139 domain-containing protein [Fulvivirga sp. M361]TRX59096.1 mucoidy inhibitor MuiA family protein [Fulvivirga sp. M361]